MASKRSALVKIHLAVLLFGLSGPFGKFLTFSPFIIVLARTFIATLVLLPKASRGDISGKKLLPFALLGVLLALHWVTFFLAIQLSTVAIGLLSFATFPVFVSFLEPVFFKERLSLRDLAFALVTFLGLCLVIPSFDLGSNLVQGALVGTFSSFTFAILSVLNRLLVQSQPADRIALLQNGFAALSLAPFIFFNPYLPTLYELILLIFLGVFCTAAAHTLFIDSLKGIKAQTASVIAALEPVYGTAFAYLLIGETQSARSLLGAAIILLATLLTTIKSREEGSPSPGSV